VWWLLSSGVSEDNSNNPRRRLFVSISIPTVEGQSFLELFAPELRTAFKAALERYPDALGMVCYENLDFNSSEFGARAALVVGPSNTLKEVPDGHTPIGDVPSRFKYPVGFCSRPALLKALGAK
jgi:hypothetical protein